MIARITLAISAACAPWVLSTSFTLGAPPLVGAQETHAFFDVMVSEILPDAPEPYGRLNSRVAGFYPYAILDKGEALYYREPAGNEPWEVGRFTRARLAIRVPAGSPVHGVLYLPDEAFAKLEPHPFTLPASQAASTAEAFQRAQLHRLSFFVQSRLAGAAWFRAQRAHLLEQTGEEVEPAPAQAWGDAANEGPMEETFALFSGGRALSENLQLDRLLPIETGEEESVDVDSIEGITVRPFDWAPLLAEHAPAIDGLSKLIPADQHAFFFPSFQALSAIHAELDRGEAFFGSLDQQGMALAAVRDRYVAQLALPWNSLVRTFGGRAIQSVAITGGDLYYPTGTDVAVLLETSEPEALVRLLGMLREAAAPDAEEQEGELHGLTWRGRTTPGRIVSTFAARIGNVVAVANSLTALEAVLRAAKGSAPNLCDTDELRFFRQRYPLNAEADEALLVIPDEAIRRWCGARWRIATSRRVRAAAVLADIQARNMDALVEGRHVRLLPDSRFPLGSVQLLESGVASDVYGTLTFQTPIAELDVTRVGKNERDLYIRWRDGYQQNWSGVFDPIAVQFQVADERLAADVSVLPLIDSTDYHQLTNYAGEERLEADDGDYHEDALAQFVMAFDKEAEFFQEYGTMASGMLPDVGPHPLAWMGDHVTVYLDRDPEFAALVADEERDVWDEWNRIPLVVVVDVSSGLKLATFLGGLRAMAEQTMPGLVAWHEESEGEHRFVRVSEEGSGEDLSLYYATTPNAWILSLHRPSLVNAMARAKARRSEANEEKPAPWEGESVAFLLKREGLDLIEGIGGAVDGAESLRDVLFDRLVILNEWKRRYPSEDPRFLHRRLWGEDLGCPGGGDLRWNGELGTMESSLLGCPADPKEGASLPPGLEGFRALSFGLTFEHQGLRAGASLSR